MVDGATYLMSMLHREHNRGTWTDDRGTNLLDGGASHYAVYETSDGKHMAVGAIEEPFYVELLQKLELTDVPERYREAWPELKEKFAERFRSKTRAEWEQIFETSDACVSPVLSLAEAPHDAHMAARGTFMKAPDGDGWEPAPAPRFSRTPGERVERDDADALLREWGL
jgi:alpha-methylacyl-CoA racemase